MGTGKRSIQLGLSNSGTIGPLFQQGEFPKSSVGETYNLGKVNTSATASLPAGETLIGMAGPFDAEGEVSP